MHDGAAESIQRQRLGLGAAEVWRLHGGALNESVEERRQNEYDVFHTFLCSVDDDDEKDKQACAIMFVLDQSRARSAFNDATLHEINFHSC